MQILFADDHWIVRESLKQVMLQVSEELEAFEADNFDRALEILDSNPSIELMLVDLIMPGFNEFEGLRKLRRHYPEIPIVVVSVHEDADYVLQSIAYGVIGYIPKTASPSDIVRALKRVLSGEVSFPRHLIAQAGTTPSRRSPEARQTPAPPFELDELTRRERTVLSLMGTGRTVGDIASELEISPQTARVHVNNAMKKLGLRNRNEIIHFAVTNAQHLGGGD
jgi:DNA-binding NarL/FixJ family response regulator